MTSTKIDLTGVVYDNEEVVQLMRRLPLAADYKTTLHIFTGLGGGNIIPLEAKVTGQEKVEVPAGTFDCYKVELSMHTPDVLVFHGCAPLPGQVRRRRRHRRLGRRDPAQSRRAVAVPGPGFRLFSDRPGGLDVPSRGQQG